MSTLILGNGHSDGPTTQGKNGKKEIGRACANYHPSVWGDRFITSSLDDKELDPCTKQRAEKLKEEVKKILSDVNNTVQKLNLIDAIQRLGVAYHFETDIEKELHRIYDDYNGNGDNLHAVALQFRLLRQQGYNVSSDVFRKFKDNEGKFKGTLSSDIQGLLSLYEAAYLGIHGDDILDEAITFTTMHLKSALPQLTSPLAKQVELALEVPLQKRVERLQSRYYISIYEEDKERSDVLLEFAKLDFNILQSLHKKELRDISRWWKENDFAVKLPFIRDRVVECYFWILGVYYEPHYSRARMIMTKIISLTSIMDDIYDVHGTLEELELYTAALESWDRGAVDQLPEYMKIHFVALLDAVDGFEEELSREGKSYRISYLKEAFKGVARAYLKEARWASSDYVPTYEEYMEVALISSAYPMLTVISLVGMGDIVTKEALEWAINVPKVVTACSVICRLKDDLTSSELEQARGHVASAMQCYMREHGTSYVNTCEIFQEMVASAWKEVNKECLKPRHVPMPVIMRAVNLARVIELLYVHQDGYTNSTRETKDRITMVMVDPVAV
ncbi:sesquiterpene synthase TPS2-like [Magnolia sinica]|uniref:sesquiterpene synthase TPS2-like n=1 Tax=Magnolia sinica TaxID=86752 RepID=UPI00265A1E2B|nr:sesquiterpene synthase TPS2-like [Magnolia sinica]